MIPTPKPVVQPRPRGTGYLTPVWQPGLGWRFKARFPDGAGGERTIGTYATEDDGHQQLNAHVAARAQRLVQPGGATFYDYGEHLIDRKGGRNVGSWRSTWRTVVGAAPFARFPIDGCRPSDIEEWVAGLLEHVSTRGKPISRQTAKHALGLVRRTFAAAVPSMIATNPAEHAALPPSNDPDDDPAWTYLEQAEIDRLLDYADLPDKQRAAFAVAIYAGLRQGELAALTWDTRTKTRRSRRVALLPAARAALQVWWQIQDRPTAGLVWPSKVGGQRHARGYDWGWSDTHDHGRRGVSWLGWRRRVGIARAVRFHDLRHTCASHLVSGTWGKAWSLREVQATLGHESESTTERYAHLALGALDFAAAATLGPIRPESVPDQRAMRDSNPRPLAPELEGSAGRSEGYEGADGSRTDHALLDALRHGRPVDRGLADALARAALTDAAELAAAGAALLQAPPEHWNQRLLDLLELRQRQARALALAPTRTGAA